MKSLRLLFLVLAQGCLALPCIADVTVPSIFGSNMVVQRNMALPVWGQADPGEKVTVALNTSTGNTVAGVDGSWTVKLPPLSAGGPYELVVTGKNKLVFTNVLVGEVWLCSGQSNMRFPVNRANNAEAEIAGARFPQIRLYRAPNKVADSPLKDNPAHWVECSFSTVPTFSAVGYFFGRDLYQKLNVPIGLMDISWGGTMIEAWMSHAALSSDPDFHPIFDKFAQQLAAYPAAIVQYNKELPELIKQHEADVAKAKAEGAGLPSGPHPPVGPGDQATPSGIYNGEICPVAPFAIRGVVWYQGEQNCKRGAQYRKLLPAFIADWRRLWQQGDFPFLIIQLPNIGKIEPQPGPSDWAELRDAQSQTSRLPNTAVVVTIDLGEAKNLHPTNKQDVGLRAALYAENLVYGQPLVPTGPIFTDMQVTGSTVRLNFKYAEGLKTRDGGPLRGFTVAGADQKFVRAQGKIEGNSVILQTDLIKNPVAVRYDWAQNPEGNLSNGVDLPTRPFRTDDFPLTSLGRNSM